MGVVERHQWSPVCGSFWCKNLLYDTHPKQAFIGSSTNVSVVCRCWLIRIVSRGLNFKQGRSCSLQALVRLARSTVLKMFEKNPRLSRGFQIAKNSNCLHYYGIQGLHISSLDAIHFRTASSTVIFSTSTSKIIGACWALESFMFLSI